MSLSFSSIFQKIKLWQFLYFSGLNMNTDVSFVGTSLLSTETRSKSTSIDPYVLKILGKRSKGTQIYSKDIARGMCEIMSLAYENRDVVAYVTRRFGGQLVYNRDSTSVLYFPDEHLVILCFAGTKVQSVQDWWTNITGTYQREWESQRNVLIKVLQDFHNDNYIVVCGHSKGGIMSILAYNEPQVDIDACYVAGVPDYFVKSSRSIGLFSIKNNKDPVTTLLGKSNAYWEIDVQNNNSPSSYSIEAHRILSYIAALQ